MDNKNNCQNDAKSPSCDIVTYAQGLVDEDNKGKPGMTVGTQPGLTKVGLGGVLDEAK